jgi:hypothetical protein
VLFPGDTPAHEYLRSLGAEILGRPDGVPGDNTPFSIDYIFVNGPQAATAYHAATGGQLPSDLLQDPRYWGCFTIKRSPHTSGDIVMFSPHVLDFLLGCTDVPPGKASFLGIGGLLLCSSPTYKVFAAACYSLQGLTVQHGA